jgi:hypothetical protein
MNSKQLAKGGRAAVAKFRSSMADGMTPTRYRVANRAIICDHCGKGTFYRGNLNAFALTIEGRAQSPTGITTLVCTTCSAIKLFTKEPVSDADDPNTQASAIPE